MVVKTADWVPFAIIALVLWGLWSLFPKLSSRYIDPKSGLIFDVIGVMIVAIGVFISMNFRLQVNKFGIFFAILTGIVGMLGLLFFWIAVSKGEASVVIPFTSLYPVVSLILAFLFLHETIDLRQGIGIVLAIISILLISL